MITDSGTAPWFSLPVQYDYMPYCPDDVIGPNLIYTQTINNITRSKADMIQEMNKLSEELKQV